MITGYGIVGFRDPFGIRPLIFGSKENRYGSQDYMLASESVALVSQGFQIERDVAPGEAVFFDVDNKCHVRECIDNAKLTPCIFEHVYLARPDSIVDEVSVYKTRLRMGTKLAEKICRSRPDHDIDVVMPIPDSGRTSAMSLAESLGVPYREGFIKNRYIGRTFIMPGQAVRKKSVRQKLSPVSLEFKDKVVCLVDDSIVRGTTCSQIIEMARDAGARKVYFCSAAPAVRFPNVYGIDMPTSEELVAFNRTDEEVAKVINADWLVYQDLHDLVECSRAGNRQIESFECSVFDGKYVTGDIDAAYMEKVAASRSDVSRFGSDSIASGDASLINVHNDT
jgi:amidophosphoribosyltransferase